MPRRPVAVDRAREHGRELVRTLIREYREARLDRGLSQDSVARAVGVDRSRISQIERGRVRDPGLVRVAELLGAVGLQLSARAYPGPGLIRDEAHVALLGRVRAWLHVSLGWALEVPLPGAGELRAWDAVVSGQGWRVGVEAETRPRDLQALARRLAIKERDGDVEGVILVLLDSRRNRLLVREHADLLHERFPVPGVLALRRLRAGRSPGGGSIVLL